MADHADEPPPPGTHSLRSSQPVSSSHEAFSMPAADSRSTLFPLPHSNALASSFLKISTRESSNGSHVQFQTNNDKNAVLQIETRDPENGAVFYYNASLGISQREKPTDMAPHPASATAPFSEDWVEAFDETSGQKYYYNRKTNLSQWEQPSAQEVNPQHYDRTVVPHATGGNLEYQVSTFPKCIGCGGWGLGLVQSWGYCNHCTRLHNLPQS